MRSNVATFCITTRKSLDQTFQPEILEDSTAIGFIADWLEMSVVEFVTNFQLYALHGKKAIAKNDNDRRKSLKTKIRGLVNGGLGTWSSYIHEPY